MAVTVNEVKRARKSYINLSWEGGEREKFMNVMWQEMECWKSYEAWKHVASCFFSYPHDYLDKGSGRNESRKLLEDMLR